MPVRTLLEGHSVGNGFFAIDTCPRRSCAGPVDQQQAAGRQPSSQIAIARPRLSGAPPKPAPTLAPPVTTATRRRSFNRLHLRRSVAALWVAPVSRCPDQTQSPRHRVQASAAGLARSDESCPTDNPSAEGASARTSTRSRSDVAASDVMVDRCSICPRMCQLRDGMCQPWAGMCPLLPTKCSLFLIPRSYAPHPVDPCCRTPDGRPLISSWAVGHLQLVARDIQAEKHRIGYSSTRRATLASRPALNLRARASGPDNCSRSAPACGPGCPRYAAVSWDPGAVGLSRPYVVPRSIRGLCNIQGAGLRPASYSCNPTLAVLPVSGEPA